jgi:ectoine hydroxylase-related dioxygenase (phytanoyl-CoA dioxygenase family)
LTTESIETHGYAIIPDVLTAERVRGLIELFTEDAVVSPGRGGRRNLLQEPMVLELAHSPELLSLVTPILGYAAFVVRGILFDKTEGANWKVPWHQDVTIAVKNRVEVEGYGPWSVKQGVQHVQPPASILQKMLSVRIHLDDCPSANGALRIIPGSHLAGKLSEAVIAGIVAEQEAIVCEVASGGALLMRPLLIHSSSAAATPQHRRVIHLDYANSSLPDGLDWFESETKATSA